MFFAKCYKHKKVRQFSAIHTAKCYLQSVREQEAAFESTPEVQNLSIIIGRIVLHSEHFHLSVYNYVSRGTYRGHVEGIHSQQHVIFTQVQAMSSCLTTNLSPALSWLRNL